SYTTIRLEPTRVMRRIFVGASQDRCTLARHPEGYSRSRKATSAAPPLDERPTAETLTGCSLSHDHRMERSWGARSQTTSMSARWIPRFTREDCTYSGLPTIPSRMSLATA